MKQGRNRTLSICLTDIPKERILKHGNGKLYLNLATYDFDEPDRYDNDFSVSIPLTKEEIERKKSGEQVNRVFLGNGRIWPDTGMQTASEKDVDDLPF
jgi:hypothetical protein